MSRRFWKGKKVFVTGHTGFKGSWLSLWLQEMGASVTGYALDPPTRPSLFELADVAKGMRSLHGDVRDLKSLMAAMKRARPQIVFHLAAQSLVPKSFREPILTYETNILGTANLLEALRYVPSVRAAVVVTSDKCYENRELHRGYREDDMVGGDEPYSASKASAELVIASYRTSFFADSNIGIASARAGNVIGGGDWSGERLIPDMIKSWMAGRTLVLRNPKGIRPWQHALKPVHGYLLLAEHLYRDRNRFSGAWNFGPKGSDEREVQWIVGHAAGMWKRNAEWKVSGNNKLIETSRLKLDSSKARRALRWSPAWPLKQALGETIAWYSAYSDGQEMRKFTIKQIGTYESSIPTGW